MRLITNSKNLIETFESLIKQYEEFYWAAAWASCPKKIFDLLLKNKIKVRKIMIGLHFYQTHPDFIEAFIDFPKVKFIEQTSGTFHPKVYLFYNDKLDWKAIVGSANFTEGAFSKNTEAVVLITASDNDADQFLKSIMSLIEAQWLNAVTFSKKNWEDYRTTWERQRPKLRSLADNYAPSGIAPKPFYKVAIGNLTWKEFIKKVKNEPGHDYKDRIAVIKMAQKLFARENHFNKLPTDARKFIAGMPNKLNEAKELDWGYFGSMRGRGDFMRAIINNSSEISAALDKIPFKGQITKKHFEDYIIEFKKVFNGNYLATATRLLAMKRPDVFICIDSKNHKLLCKDFGIKYSGMNYERYWTEIIEQISNCEWWQNPSPQNSEEILISQARAAFLDSLYYEI